MLVIDKEQLPIIDDQTMVSKINTVLTKGPILSNGHLNLGDGLYNIPLYPSEIATLHVNNFKMPHLHGLYYNPPVQKNPAPTQLPTRIKPFLTRLPKTHINIITQRRLDHLINQAHQHDNKHPSPYPFFSANVIL